MAKNLNKDTVYSAAKPKEKDYTINDGEGLVLLVKTSGSKLRRFIYRIDGKQNRLLQLLPFGAKVTGRDSHPLKNSAFSRRTTK